jgi:hypothetical protein
MTRYLTTSLGDLQLPRVWISADWPVGPEWFVSTTENPNDTFQKPVDMNASLYRQILHAQKQYNKFQEILKGFHAEASKHPTQVRRVR